MRRLLRAKSYEPQVVEKNLSDIISIQDKCPYLLNVVVTSRRAMILFTVCRRLAKNRIVMVSNVGSC